MKLSNSVFNVLAEEGLTTMEVFYNREEDKFTLRGLREWEERVAWDRYMVDFTPEDILTDNYKAIGVVDINKEQKANLAVNDLLVAFERASGEAFDDDSILLRRD